MNVFFEESGSFKAGSVLSRQGDAFQVELPGGRRAKVRAKDVLIEFEKPAAGELMQQADEAAQQIDLDFLWECAPAEEFAYAALADEYFGASYGPVERAALVLRLHGAPVYFRRKGRGQYQRAPEEQLKMALAGLERKRQQALVQAGYEEELKAGRLPDAFAGKALGLLTKPDKNSIEYKALDAAALARGVSPARLMLDCGGIPSARALHEARFLAEYFPHGTGFPPSRSASCPRICRARTSTRSRSTTSRRPKSTTRSPSSTCPTGACGSACTSRRPRSASCAAMRSTRSRARGCRPSTCRATRSRCCRTTSSTCSR